MKRLFAGLAAIVMILVPAESAHANMHTDNMHTDTISHR